MARGDAIVISGPPPQHVGRGGTKLAGALDDFGLSADGKRCLDAGSSTGGFTDCLLQRGAATVHAVDVGHGQLHEKLLVDSRVISMERTDIRALGDELPGVVFDLVVADLSFISTTRLLPVFQKLLARSGDMVVLIKPQFEAGRSEVSKRRGIIKDRDIWVRVLHDFIDEAVSAHLEVVDLAISPITGGKGNVEFLGHLRHGDILESVPHNFQSERSP